MYNKIQKMIFKYFLLIEMVKWLYELMITVLSFVRILKILDTINSLTKKKKFLGRWFTLPFLSFVDVF